MPAHGGNGSLKYGFGLIRALDPTVAWASEPMYHRQDADATKSDAHGLFRIRIRGLDGTPGDRVQ